MAKDDKPNLDRRGFLGAATLGVAAAGAAAVTATPAPAKAELLFPTDRDSYARGGPTKGPMSRAEAEIFDVEVEGNIPEGLDGAFYRVGPDFQYPKAPHVKPNSWFDGEGHISMIRIQNGHVDYRSRFVRNTRWKLQHAARKSLYGTYRNPYSDDPSVKGKSRAEHNTQIWYHDGKLLALKEDTPPAWIDPLTLDTIDENYTFGGQLKSQTFTAHPKTDSVTGDLVAFGYEAKGLGSTDINVFSITPKGKMNWQAWVKAPYCGMLHDWAVTEKHIAFLAIPLAYNAEGMPLGEVHWAWNSKMPTYLGVMRRGGDGSDIRWIKGPQTFCTHTMGCWSDGEKVYVDMDGGDGNQFSFFPSRTEPYDPVAAVGRLRRFSIDLSNKNNTSFDMEVLHPAITGALSRQDDRYHTQAYRYGFINGANTALNKRGWVMFDHAEGRTETFSLPDTNLSEMVFIPRKKGAPEGDGYLIGAATKPLEGGRSDILIVDTKDLSGKPVATIKFPMKLPPQIHGLWVDGAVLPKAKA